MSESTAATAIGRVSTVMVPVADQDRAIEFYTEKLGFEKVADIPFGDGERWVAVVPPGAETTIALVLPREGKRPGSRPASGSRAPTSTPTTPPCASAASTSIPR